MARMLGRSRSMKMLRGLYKDAHQKDAGDVAPPSADSKADYEKIKPLAHAATVNVRVETPELSQRPRTSGGAADRGRLFHKKVVAATPDTEIKAFDFPIPSSTATTVLYATEVHEVREEGIIGIALGSPTMASHWNTSPQTTDYVTSGHGTVTHISSPNSTANSTDGKHESTKHKLGRWRSIFGRKTSPRQQQHQPPPKSTPFYQLQQSPVPVATASPARVDSHHEDEHLEPHAVSKPDDEPVSIVLFKPEIRESRKTMMPPKQPSVEQPGPRPNRDTTYGLPRPTLKRQETGSSTTSFPPKEKTASPTIPTVVVSSGPQSSSPRPIIEKPILDVQIPSVKMERYSVMFGSLLQPNRSSSLLVRRQGNQDKLKPLNELSLKVEEDLSHNGSMKPQRRATSPSMPKSPISLSLFPQPEKPRDNRVSTARMSARQSRMLQRSKTAPPGSPSKQFFAKELEDVSRELSKSSTLAADEDPGMKTLMLPPTPSSFASSLDEITIGVEAWESRRGEPQWEIVRSTTNPVTQDELTVAPLKVRADKKSNAQGGVTQKADETTPQNVSQATVGIARSVSVSRAAGLTQKDMMKPMIINTADPLEKLVDKKPLTPTFVEIQNRKSQRVQILEA